METVRLHKTGYNSVGQLEDLLDETDGAVTTLANASAFLFAMLPDVNWAGFYLLRDGALYLGPFQGKPACTRIAVGKGVCGTAVAEGKTQRVDDVHAFPGHIACDSRSKSEIVVPLRNASGEITGVLDIDSKELASFDEVDAEWLEKILGLLL